MKAAHDTLTSARLAVRRYTAGDLDLLVRLHTDPEVTRFAGGLLTRDQSEAMLRERILAYYDEHPGLGIWLTVERETGAPVGMHILNHIRGSDIVQVGYLLYPQYWGRGYATEMGERLLRYGFEELGLPQISGITDLPHVDSQRVLLKIGLHRAGERHFPAYGAAPLAFFTRDAGSWLAEHPAS
jgi:ribosomal-protein-alanine N-acetyltransferase